MRDPRLYKLAKVLVRYSVGVQPGQLVRISSPTPGLPLAVELFREVLEAGGHPFIRSGPAETQEILLKNGTDEQLKYVNPLNVLEAEKIDCSISVWADENTRSLTNVDSKRAAILSASRRPVMEVFLQRAADKKLRWTGTQYPTLASAQDAEMSLSEYEDFVFKAGRLDQDDPVAVWKKISGQQQKLADFLNGKTEYRVVSPNGTDVRMSLAGHQWINCDGHENFPDGEVFSGPVLDLFVNGQINFSFPTVYLGREVTDVKLTFRNGKVVDASASKGLDFLISMLDMDGGSRLLGECAIGTNYDITRYTRNTLFDEKIGGTVHFALGSGYPETGNSNSSGLHWDMVVDLRQGGYVEIDGIKISQDGRFLREGWPGK